MEQYVLVFAVFTILAVLVYSQNPSTGPFDIQIEEVGQCDEKGNGDIVIENLAIKSVSKNVMHVSFEATNKVPFDDDIFVTARVTDFDEEKKEFNPKAADVPIGSACRALAVYLPKTIDKLYKALGVEGCPVAPNTYKVKDFPFEFDLPVNKLPYKKYRSDMMLQKNDATLVCARVIFRLVPEGTYEYPK